MHGENHQCSGLPIQEWIKACQVISTIQDYCIMSVCMTTPFGGQRYVEVQVLHLVVPFVLLESIVWK